MNDENAGAPGPIDPSTHIDPKAEKSDRPTDERAIRLEVQRQAEAAGEVPEPQFREFSDPAGAILIQEVQELKGRLDSIGAIALGSLFLLGLALGLAFVSYARTRPADTGGEE